MKTAEEMLKITVENKTGIEGLIKNMEFQAKAGYSYYCTNHYIDDDEVLSLIALGYTVKRVKDRIDQSEILLISW